MAVAKTAILERLDEVFEKDARDGRINRRPCRRVLAGESENVGEQFLQFRRFQ
jgi:hypothetical protein